MDILIFQPLMPIIICLPLPAANRAAARLRAALTGASALGLAIKVINHVQARLRGDFLFSDCVSFTNLLAAMEEYLAIIRSPSNFACFSRLLYSSVKFAIVCHPLISTPSDSSLFQNLLLIKPAPRINPQSLPVVFAKVIFLLAFFNLP